MATVNVHPIPSDYHKISQRFRPMPAPIFSDGDPTPADIELARELFLALDLESQRRYRGWRIFADLIRG